MKCGIEIDAGSSFCGNCGQPVASEGARPDAEPKIPITGPNVSQYQSVAPVPDGGKKAIASLILGILGLVAWIIPIAGLVTGTLSIFFGSVTIKSNRRGFAIAGIILGIICVLLSLFAFGYNVSEYLKENEIKTSLINIFK